MFVTPPVAGLDEEQHYYRAYQLSDLNIKSDKIAAPNVYGEQGIGYGGSLPVSVFQVINKLRNTMAPDLRFEYREVAKEINTPLNPDQRTLVRFDNTAIYSPLAYLPQAIGMNIGKVIGVGPVWIGYLGRLVMLASWIGMLYLAIRLSPVGKWAFVAVALNPASLFLASSLSADAMAIGVVALFAALVLYLRRNTKPLGIKAVVGLALLMVVLALQKNAYLPVLLLSLLIPSGVIRPGLKYGLLIVSLTIGLLWNVAVLDVASHIPQYFSIDLNVSSGEQIEFVLQHPLKFAAILLWNIFGIQSLILTPGFAGLASDTLLPYWSTLLWFGAFFVAISIKDSRTVVASVQRKPSRYGFLAVAAMGFAAILLSLYVGWNAVGAVEITGVQPRYFIPILFVLIPVVTNTKKYIEYKGGDSVMLLKMILLIVLTAASITIAVRYGFGIR